VAFKR